MISEAETQIMVADYLRMQYPHVIFVSNYGAGAKLTMKQATIQKCQNGGRRGLPDMLILEPMNGYLGAFDHYNGLAIELKRDGEKLRKRNGDWKNKHIEEQWKILCELKSKRYAAEFAVGFEGAKRLIDLYLGGGYSPENYEARTKAH